MVASASRWVSWTTCAYTFIVTPILGMAEDLHDDSRRDTLRGQQRGAPVSSVMQADDRNGSLSRQPPKRPVDVTGLDRTPRPGCEGVARLMPPLPRSLP